MPSITSLFTLLAAASIASAAPAPINWNGEAVTSYAPLPDIASSQSTLYAPYTAADAFADCMGKGAGEYVAWANEDSQKYGILNGKELKKEGKKAVRELMGVPLYCCREDPWVDLNIDENFAGVVDIEKKVALGRKCTPIWWSG